TARETVASATTVTDSVAADSPFTSGMRLVSAGLAPFDLPAARDSAPAQPAPPAAPAAAPEPEGFMPLYDLSVTVRDGGTSARSEPSLDAETLGALPAGARRDTDGLVFGEYTWLRTPWEGPDVDDAWLP